MMHAVTSMLSPTMHGIIRFVALDLAQNRWPMAPSQFCLPLATRPMYTCTSFRLCVIAFLYVTHIQMRLFREGHGGGGANTKKRAMPASKAICSPGSKGLSSKIGASSPVSAAAAAMAPTPTKEAQAMALDAQRAANQRMAESLDEMEGKVSEAEAETARMRTELENATASTSALEAKITDLETLLAEARNAQCPVHADALTRCSARLCDEFANASWWIRADFRLKMEDKLGTLVMPGDVVGSIAADKGEVWLGAGLMQNQSQVVATKAGVFMVQGSSRFWVESNQKRVRCKGMACVW